MPALLPVPLAAEVLQLPVAEVEAAVAAGELPVVYRGGGPYVVSRRLLVEMGVPADHPDLPPAVEDEAGEVA